jgi:hypothetical protein
MERWEDGKIDRKILLPKSSAVVRRHLHKGPFSTPQSAKTGPTAGVSPIQHLESPPEYQNNYAYVAKALGIG